MQAPDTSTSQPASSTDAAADESIEIRNINFASKDGTTLFATLYPTADPNPRGNALILHGYADHGGRYQEVAGNLNASGLNALCVDLRGHGRSDGDRGLIKKFDDYLEDVEAALAQLVEHFGEREVLLLGHSNGGLIALRLLADPFRCPKSIKAAVISSPFLALQLKAPAKVLFAKVASRLLPRLALPNEIVSADLSHDLAKVKEHDHDTLCHDVASARWFTEAVATQQWVEEFAHRIAVPSLWLVAGSDKLADPAQTRKVHARLSSESSYQEFPDMYHEVFNETERAQVFHLLTEFCAQKFQ